MMLFNSDLYRNFGIGFGLGVVLVILSKADGLLLAVPQMVASIL